MKLEDLPILQREHLPHSDDLLKEVKALEQRLAYAKELLNGANDWSHSWDRAKDAFIEKLDAEGL